MIIIIIIIIKKKTKEVGGSESQEKGGNGQKKKRHAAPLSNLFVFLVKTTYSLCCLLSSDHFKNFVCHQTHPNKQCHKHQSQLKEIIIKKNVTTILVEENKNVTTYCLQVSRFYLVYYG